MTQAMKTIRGLERGITVLQALAAEPGMDLKRLHACTHFPKPTLLRILGTLERKGMIWRAIADGRYRNSVSLRELGATQHRHHRLGEIAAPILEELRGKVVWPSDLAVRNGYHLQLVETSRGTSHLAVNRDPYGHKVDMLMSAVGRAYLAFCPDREREHILAHLERHPEHRLDPAAWDAAAIRRGLEETRASGYAVRHPRFGGSARMIEDFDDGLRALAVPVISSSRVLGCVNIVWLHRFNLEKEIARSHLDDLQAAARIIAAALRKAGHAVKQTQAFR